MTNELKNLLILLLSVTLSVSCHKESPAGPDESRIITVCTDCDKMTRSGGMTADGLKEKYFYLLIDQTDEAPDYFVRMVWDGTGWKPEDNTLMEAATGDLSGAIVTALFYDSQVSLTMEEFRTQSSYRLEYGGTSATGYSPDILYATNVPGTSSLDSGAVEVSGTAVNIRFAHAMSRLKFDCSQDITVSRISISGMADSFTWNAATNGGYASGISTSQSADIALTGDVYEAVEQMPEFPGGMAGLMQYITKNLRYPEEAKAKGIQGRVTVRVVVNTEGKVTNAEVLRGADPVLDAEALRVASSLPDWKPGMKDGKPVNVRFIFPVNFSLQ